MRTTHPPCGKSWGGLKAEHCPACCQTFSTTRGGDRHRKGPGEARYCVDPASVGLVLGKDQIWRFPGPGPDGQGFQESPGDSLPGTNLIGE